MVLARVLGGVGRLLIWLGVLVLLFVGYQLWGTGLAHSRAQDSLQSDFEDRIEQFTTTEPSDEPESTTTTAPAPPPPEAGDSIAHIVIPTIGVDEYVVEGVGRSDLKKGPGHYPDTPMPGQPGNSAIAGHRTTYGQPFHNIDKLVPGDEILITTLQGTFRYEMMEQQIVKPSAIEVLDDFDDNRLTLTACHPKYSARQRIVVTAQLAVAPAPPTTVGAPPEPVATVINGEAKGPWAPVIMWGLFALIVWIAFWALSRRWRRWPSYAAGAVPFAATLFVFYGHVERLMPSGY